jgi:hypothetical protein
LDASAALRVLCCRAAAAQAWPRRMGGPAAVGGRVIMEEEKVEVEEKEKMWNLVSFLSLSLSLFPLPPLSQLTSDAWRTRCDVP